MGLSAGWGLRNWVGLRLLAICSPWCDAARLTLFVCVLCHSFPIFMPLALLGASHLKSLNAAPFVCSIFSTVQYLVIP
jgi:hypothetical protein